MDLLERDTELQLLRRAVADEVREPVRVLRAGALGDCAQAGAGG